jgi:hypothetical protein
MYVAKVKKNENGDYLVQLYKLIKYNLILILTQ